MCEVSCIAEYFLFEFSLGSSISFTCIDVITFIDRRVVNSLMIKFNLTQPTFNRSKFMISCTCRSLDPKTNHSIHQRHRKDTETGRGSIKNGVERGYPGHALVRPRQPVCQSIRGQKRSSCWRLGDTFGEYTRHERVLLRARATKTLDDTR